MSTKLGPCEGTYVVRISQPIFRSIKVAVVSSTEVRHPNAGERLPAKFGRNHQLFLHIAQLSTHNHSATKKQSARYARPSMFVVSWKPFVVVQLGLPSMPSILLPTCPRRWVPVSSKTETSPMTVKNLQKSRNSNTWWVFGKGFGTVRGCHGSIFGPTAISVARRFEKKTRVR